MRTVYKDEPNKIAKVRKSKGFTRSQLADKVGIPYATLTNYENNKRFVPFSVYQELAKVLGVKVVDIAPDFITLSIDINEYVNSLIESGNGDNIQSESFLNTMKEKFPNMLDKDYQNLMLLQQSLNDMDWEQLEYESKIRSLLNEYKKLNDKGQNEVIGYATYLATKDEYTKKDTE